MIIYRSFTLFILFLISNYSFGNQFEYTVENKDLSYDSKIFKNDVFLSSSNETDLEIVESDPNLEPFPGESPINDYLPLLAVAAVGLVFYYRKELKQRIKTKN